MRCTQIVEAGTYVLGALSPAERSAYQRHMASCEECRAEVADLAGLPGLLGRLDEATAVGLSGGEASAAPVPPNLLPGVLSTARAERARNRRQYRWRTAVASVAAAACAALVAGLTVSAASQPATAPHVPPGVVLAAMEAVQQGEPVTGVIGYQAAAGGGTDIYMSCMYADTSPDPDDDWSFRLMVYPRATQGTPISVQGSRVKDWHAYPGQYMRLMAHTAWDPAHIDRIEVQLANGTRLLAYQAT